MTEENKEKDKCTIQNVSTWLPVDGNEKAFHKASLKNCECSFDYGTIFNFNSIDTDAELTHFKTEY